RQFGKLAEVACEGSRRLRARGFASIHIDGKTQYKADRRAFDGEREQSGCVNRESFSRDGLNARCKLAFGVAGSNPDCLCSEVNAQQSAARRKMRSSLCKRQNDRHVLALARVSDAAKRLALHGTVPGGKPSA